MQPIIILLLLLPVFAQAQERIIEPSQVIDVLSEDLDGDAIPDKAVLYYYADHDFADLSVYIGGQNGVFLPEIVYLPKVAWNGYADGTVPYLSINDTGSLELHSGNETVGPSRWFESLTLTYAGDHFVIEAYTFDQYETRDENAGGVCTVNFLSGKGQYLPNSGDSPQSFHVPQGSANANDWTPDMIPDLCAAG